MTAENEKKKRQVKIYHQGKLGFDGLKLSLSRVSTVEHDNPNIILQDG